MHGLFLRRYSQMFSTGLSSGLYFGRKMRDSRGFVFKKGCKLFAIPCHRALQTLFEPRSRRPAEQPLRLLGGADVPVDLAEPLGNVADEMGRLAERVEDERTVVQLLEYNVDFAQGYLFGEPRAVRDDTVKALEKNDASAPIIPFRKTA